MRSLSENRGSLSHTHFFSQFPWVYLKPMKWLLAVCATMTLWLSRALGSHRWLTWTGHLEATEEKNKRTTKQTENNEQSSNKSWPFNNDFKCKCIKPSKWKMLSGLSRLKNKTQRHTLDFMTHIGWKWRGRDRDSMQILIKRKQSGKREVKPKPSQAT